MYAIEHKSMIKKAREVSTEKESGARYTFFMEKDKPKQPAFFQIY